MSKIKFDKGDNIFGALKFIEQLYHDGEISFKVFSGIIQEYSCCLTPKQIESFNYDKEDNYV